MTEAETKKVGQHLADDWMQGLEENTPEQVFAAIEAFGIDLSTLMETFHGDGAVLSLAQTFRDTADAIETRMGEFIKGDVRRSRALAERRKAA